MNKYKLIPSLFTLSIAAFTLLIGCSASFIEAVKDGDIDVVEEKISSNSNDVDLNNGLFFASKDGKYEMVKLLINEGANPNSNEANWNPLYLAANNGYLDIAKFLIGNGADVNLICKSKARTIKDNEIKEENGLYHYQFIKTSKGETPLSAAISKGDIPIVTLLLKNEANPNTSLIFEDAHHNVGGGYVASGYSYSSAISVEGIVRRITIDRKGNAVSNIRPSFEKRLSLLQISKELKYNKISKLLVDYGAVE